MRAEIVKVDIYGDGQAVRCEVFIGMGYKDIYKLCEKHTAELVH